MEVNAKIRINLTDLDGTEVQRPLVTKILCDQLTDIVLGEISQLRQLINETTRSFLEFEVSIKGE